VVARRIRRRHRLLDAFVRLELEDRALWSDDQTDSSRREPSLPRLEVARQSADDGEDAREDRPALRRRRA
jgi:hypothetical protein